MTIRLTNGEIELLKRPEPALSKVPAGHWRVRWWMAPAMLALPGAELIPGTIVCGNDEYIGPERHVSRDVAETWAQQTLDKLPWVVRHLMAFRRAEYFAGERP